jgi:hypothetical protein
MPAWKRIITFVTEDHDLVLQWGHADAGVEEV